MLLPPEPYADELPPDFWRDTLAPPDTSQAIPDEPFGSDTMPSSSPVSSPVRPLEGKLQHDSRFMLLQELFPGHISDWQSAEMPANTAENDADDAPPGPGTVDLEGLDSEASDDDTE